MLTGNQSVDGIANLPIRGNVIPELWYQNIRFKSGKVDLNAIVILAEILYWYRPTEERDENSGLTVGYRKKFQGDKLRRTYQALADKFGLSKRQATEACHRLKDAGLITLEFRTERIAEVNHPNVLYIGINPEAIAAITLSRSNGTPSHVQTEHPLTFKRDTLPRSNGTPSHVQTEDVLIYKTSPKISSKTSPESEKARAQKSEVGLDFDPDWPESEDFPVDPKSSESDPENKNVPARVEVLDNKYDSAFVNGRRDRKQYYQDRADEETVNSRVWTVAERDEFYRLVTARLMAENTSLLVGKARAIADGWCRQINCQKIASVQAKELWGLYRAGRLAMESQPLTASAIKNEKAFDAAFAAIGA